MSKSYVPKALRELVAAQARNRCGYCLTQQEFVGFSMEVEHTIPEALGGATEEDNLWLACTQCNLHKGDRIIATDPLSRDSVRLFDPRHQHWQDHFEWADDATIIIGRTQIGRATVVALKLNREVLVVSRRWWVIAGWHPPHD